jgi:hypothetical protein
MKRLWLEQYIYISSDENWSSDYDGTIKIEDQHHKIHQEEMPKQQKRQLREIIQEWSPNPSINNESNESYAPTQCSQNSTSSISTFEELLRQNLHYRLERHFNENLSSDEEWITPRPIRYRYEESTDSDEVISPCF